jgi:hypothetical protein
MTPPFILVAALLAPLFSQALIQEKPVTSARWARELDALSSGDVAAIAEAHRAFAADPEAARAALEEKFRDLARRPSAGTLRVLIEIMRSFRALGPGAAPAIPFLASSPFLLDEEKMTAWREEGTGEAVALRNELWEEMRLAIGATGRLGLERLVKGATAEESTGGGVPYASILYTILPNGAESIAAVAELAFSGDDSRRNFGRHLARYAEDDLGPQLSARLESEDPRDRARVLALASDNLPHSASFLCGLLASADDVLRRGALTALIRCANPYQLDPKSAEYRGYMEWHGNRHPTPERPFRILESLRSKNVVGPVARSLAHKDEATRVLAAFLLMRVARPGAPVPAELLDAANDESLAVQYWAREAVRRLEALDDRWLRALRALPPAPKWPAIEHFAERERAAVAALRSDVGAFAALAPAETCEEAICRLEALTSEVRDAWPEDEVRLRVLETIRHRDMERVVAEVDEGFFGQGIGYDGLGRFGLAALPEFEADYLQDPRFSVGAPVFEDRHATVLSLGRDAFPLIAQALFHWREEPRETHSKRALEALDTKDAALARAILDEAEAWAAREKDL